MNYNAMQENSEKTCLVLTIAIGLGYQTLAALTHPTLRAYAERIGADFQVITTPKVAVTSPHWAKFEIAELLEKYERILYFDTDIIVRDDCPNLFDLVPDDCLGAFNEAPFVARSRELLIDVCRAYGVTLDTWDNRYFNSGVLVISRCHQELFIKPAHEECNFYEQTYFNVKIALLGIKMFELPYQYNRMSCLDAFTGESRLAAYVTHYAGAPSLQQLLPLVRQDLATWEAKKPDYAFKRNIHVVVSGGLGDQVNAQPAIRYMRNHIYPDDRIVVTTHWPELFAGLDVEVYKHGQFFPEPDTAYYVTQSLPPPQSIQWMVVSNLLCHTVDYASMALLRRILPMADKRIHLNPSSTDTAHLYSEAGYANLKDVVVVHAGRHWQSKTFPLSWWQEVVDELAFAGLTVCLIGHDDDTRGVVPVECPQDGLDLRNRLSLKELIALLKEASVLISNDSAPIHLAGAFDNWIILVPSCKEPEHVLPWRHGSVWWHAQALYKRLTLHDVSSRPTDVHGSSADCEVQDWSIYLPEVAEVVQAVVDGVAYARD